YRADVSLVGQLTDTAAMLGGKALCPAVEATCQAGSNAKNEERSLQHGQGGTPQEAGPLQRRDRLFPSYPTGHGSEVESFRFSVFGFGLKKESGSLVLGIKAD